mmetsp:Transcript_19748/g.50534  ORF Transcript_19748/g.50534 Transcript_19748/m.50534 type:complete len:259 (+) Transcript_19748:575-1351(+)
MAARDGCDAVAGGGGLDCDADPEGVESRLREVGEEAGVARLRRAHSAPAGGDNGRLLDVRVRPRRRRHQKHAPIVRVLRCSRCRPRALLSAREAAPTGLRDRRRAAGANARDAWTLAAGGRPERHRGVLAAAFKPGGAGLAAGIVPRDAVSGGVFPCAARPAPHPPPPPPGRHHAQPAPRAPRAAHVSAGGLPLRRLLHGARHAGVWPPHREVQRAQQLLLLPVGTADVRQLRCAVRDLRPQRGQHRCRVVPHHHVLC